VTLIEVIPIGERTVAAHNRETGAYTTKPLLSPTDEIMPRRIGGGALGESPLCIDEAYEYIKVFI